jgi:3-hydroxybutyryl-CoA dehydrogenase
MTKIKKVAVAGSGTMGLGIAQVCAMAGYNTLLYDIKDDLLDRAKAQIKQNLSKTVSLGKISELEMNETLDRLVFTSDLKSLVVDLVIEAIPEKLELKVSFFNELSKINSLDTILATNTSSIPVTQIAAAVEHPERIIGLHFFNPAHIMKLVEIIEGAHTDKSISEICYDFVQSLGKVGVMAQDAPGFIVNRVARHYYVEGLKILEEGVGSIETIDLLMESSGFKMGPFKLMDLIGVDTNYAVTESMFTLFNYENRFRPSRIQKQKVLAGMHGRKTGKGFYSYTKD